MSDTWQLILDEYLPRVGEVFIHGIDGKEYVFFGLVNDGEDYYYGMSCTGAGVVLASCVGRLDDMGFTTTGKRENCHCNTGFDEDL